MVVVLSGGGGGGTGGRLGERLGVGVNGGRRAVGGGKSWRGVLGAVVCVASLAGLGRGRKGWYGRGLAGG